MQQMNLLMDFVALGCGLYCLYTCVRLLITRRLFANGLLIPKEKSAADCRDAAAYIRTLLPPLAALALVTTAYGVLLALSDLSETALLPGLWGLAPLAGVLGALVWYSVVNKRAIENYFDV